MVNLIKQLTLSSNKLLCNAVPLRVNIQIEKVMPYIVCIENKHSIIIIHSVHVRLDLRPHSWH